MSPEKAKVYVVEDDEDYQFIIQNALENEGHGVVGRAQTREQALAAAKHLRLLGVNVATIDGNLDKTDHSGADGQAVLIAIRTYAPEVKTVGVSGSGVKGADANVSKRGLSDKLGKVVRGL